MNMPWKRQEEPVQDKAEAFLTTCKEQHQQLFAEYLDKAGTYSSLETFAEALREADWELTVAKLKESYRNGIASGMRRGRIGNRPGVTDHTRGR
jgi:hypothetical protein